MAFYILVLFFTVYCKLSFYRRAPSKMACAEGQPSIKNSNMKYIGLQLAFLINKCERYYSMIL